MFILYYIIIYIKKRNIDIPWLFWTSIELFLKSAYFTESIRIFRTSKPIWKPPTLPTTASRGGHKAIPMWGRLRIQKERLKDPLQVAFSMSKQVSGEWVVCRRRCQQEQNPATGRSGGSPYKSHRDWCLPTGNDLFYYPPRSNVFFSW